MSMSIFIINISRMELLHNNPSSLRLSNPRHNHIQYPIAQTGSDGILVDARWEGECALEGASSQFVEEVVRCWMFWLLLLLLLLRGVGSGLVGGLGG